MIFIADFIGDKFILKVIFMLSFLGIIIEIFLFYSNISNDAWRFFEEIIIKNIISYQNAKQRIDLMKREMLLQQRYEIICDRFNISRSYTSLWILRVCGKLEAFWKFELIDKKCYLENDFELMRFVDFNTRRRTILFTILSEFILTATLVIMVAVTYIIGANLIITNVYGDNSILLGKVFSIEYIKMVIDTIAGYVFIIKLYENGVYILFLAVVSSLIYSDSLKSCNNSMFNTSSALSKQMNMSKYIKGKEKKSSKNAEDMQILRNVHRFVCIHARICRIQVRNNKSSFSKMAFCTFSLTFISHCYCLTKFVLSKIRPFQKLILFLLLIVETAIMIFSLIPLAHVNRCFHKTKNVLPKILLNISRINISYIKNNRKYKIQIIPLKLKLLQTYERITYGPKYGSRIGILGTVTYTLLIEFIFLYGAYFMTFAKMIFINKFIN